MRGVRTIAGRVWGARGLGLGLGLGLLLPCVVLAEDGSPKPAGSAPPVALDALFKLPSQTPRLEAPERGGDTQRRWIERFDVARDDLARARARLEATQAELEKLASNSQTWQVAAPGGQAGGESGPLSFKLRQQIRRDREEVETAEHNLSELRVEAELAGVPLEWTGEPAPPPVEDAQP